MFDGQERGCRGLSRSASEEGGSGQTYRGDELRALQKARTYYSWLLDEFRPCLKGRCLEVGAGTGTFTRYLLSSDISEIHCIEPSANLLDPLREVLSESSKPAKLVPADLEGFHLQNSATFDCIVCVNVLEHIADDYKATRILAEHLVPGGNICLFVPALPGLYGTLDLEFNHYRRYKRGELAHLLRSAGLEIRKLTYFNMAGVFTWAIMGKVLKRRTFSPTLVAAYDRLIAPLLRKLESTIRPPFGQSLLAVAQKPAGGGIKSAIEG
jgi:SAM-dependent methyltransferase